MAAGRGDKVAYHFVSEPEGEEDRAITFSQLKDDVCRFASALRKLGIGKGDVVGIYMGMVPELPIAMLACARLGAPHVVVFGGFSAEALGERLESTGAKLLITQDEAWRKGNRWRSRRSPTRASSWPRRSTTRSCSSAPAQMWPWPGAATIGGTT